MHANEWAEKSHPTELHSNRTDCDSAVNRPLGQTWLCSNCNAPSAVYCVPFIDWHPDTLCKRSSTYMCFITPQRTGQPPLHCGELILGGKGCMSNFFTWWCLFKKHLKYTGFLNITHCNTLERGLKCSAQSKFTVLIQKKWRFSFKAISNLATHVGHSVLNSSTLDLIGFMYTQLIMTAGHGKRKPLQNCIAILLCFAARGQNVSLLNAILPFSGEGGWSSTKCSSS